MGCLHHDFMVCRTFWDVNLDVAYHGFAVSQGHHKERQLAYIWSGKDHYKSFDDLSTYLDGITDDLVLLYVLRCSLMCPFTTPTHAATTNPRHPRRRIGVDSNLVRSRLVRSRLVRSSPARSGTSTARRRPLAVGRLSQPGPPWTNWWPSTL